MSALIKTFHTVYPTNTSLQQRLNPNTNTGLTKTVSYDRSHGNVVPAVHERRALNLKPRFSFLKDGHYGIVGVRKKEIYLHDYSSLQVDHSWVRVKADTGSGQGCLEPGVLVQFNANKQQQGSHQTTR